MLGKFEESTEAWQHVLKYNNLYPLAYSGLGMSALRQGQYQEAVRYFRLGNNRNYYSKAFAYHRKDVIEENFLKIMVGVIGAVIGIVIIARIRSGREKTIYDASKVKGWRRLVDALRYALHVCVNPIEGFWTCAMREEAVCRQHDYSAASFNQLSVFKTVHGVLIQFSGCKSD